MPEEFKVFLKRVGSEDGSVDHVKRFKRKDGTVGWVDASSRPRMNETGEFIGFEGTFRGITERKRMENEKAQYKSRLEALHKHAIEINSARSLAEIAEATLDVVETVLGFEWLALGIVEGDRLRFVSTRGATFIQEFAS